MKAKRPIREIVILAVLLFAAGTPGCSSSDSGGSSGGGAGGSAACPDASSSTTLDMGLQSGSTVAVGAGSAFYLGQGIVLKSAPLAGGTPPTTLFTPQGPGQFTLTLAADDNAVFLLSFDGQVSTAPAHGGAVMPFASKLSRYAYSRLALDATSVYLSNSTGVLKAPRSGGSFSPLVAAQQPSTLAVDGSGVYWLTVDGGKIHLSRAGLDGSGGRELSAWTGVSSIALALDEKNAYVTVTRPFGDGSVYAVPKAGGAPVELAKKQPESVVIASDGTNVYYGVHPTPTTSAIRRVPVGGGAQTDVVCVTGKIFGLVVTGDAVVWSLTANAPGEPSGVYKTPKVP